MPKLDQIPRVRFAHLPTPIEPLPRLSAHLGGPKIYVKRDDCTGAIAFSGNKTRKLEFAMAEAVAAGADTIVTSGSVQSNHSRQTAAACAKLGLSCVLVLHEHFAGSQNFLVSGNVMLDRILGAEIRLVHAPPSDDDLRRIADELSKSGRKPFVMPCGASTPVGALGYVVAANEIADFCDETNIVFDHIVVTSGSVGTHAGLLVGLHAAQKPIPVLGIGVGGHQTNEVQESLTWTLVQETGALLGISALPVRSDVVADCSYRGEYAAVEDATLEAIELVARHEGLILDPSYTGVTMARLIALIREGRFTSQETVLFIHTGGSSGLFGYVDRIANRL